MHDAPRLAWRREVDLKEQRRLTLSFASDPLLNYMQWYSSVQLKHKPKLSLELPMQIRLCVSAGDETEVRRVDVQHRAIQRGRHVRLGMIEHVRCVQTELQALPLCYLDGLGDIRVKSPAARRLKRAHSERSTVSGKRVLKKKLPGFCIHNRVQCASGLESLQRGDLRALGILNLRQIAIHEVRAASAARGKTRLAVYIE